MLLCKKSGGVLFRILELSQKNSRLYSQTVFPVLSFTDVKKEIQSNKVILLDVREKGELTTDGKISQGKNVPVGEVINAFTNLDDVSFEEQYGFPKPKNDQNIVVHCKAGVRAQLAANALSQLGFTNLKVYPGINDWKENGGEVS